MSLFSEILDSLSNRLAYNKLRYVRQVYKKSPEILFMCGFHGKSGGPIAIASIANGLSHFFNVSFLLSPSSYYNRLLSVGVKPVSVSPPNIELVICDLSINPKVLAPYKDKGTPILLTIHGLRHALHKLPDVHINSMLQLADKVHFVGQVQQDSYQLSNEHYFIIPNSAWAINKTIHARNIGSVGNLDEARKRTALTVTAGLQSQAEKIHLWSCSRKFSQDNRVIHHEWESDKQLIFNSLDVLVFLSEQETFGLVIAEALSAGIPCVLSAIPAFAPFASCPGVVLLEESQLAEAPAYIDTFLAQKEQLAPLIRRFYVDNFSPQHIDKLWLNTLNTFLSINKSTSNL
jgi:glycosyltransferase involved in cell wall biosynthesis